MHLERDAQDDAAEASAQQRPQLRPFGCKLPRLPQEGLRGTSAIIIITVIIPLSLSSYIFFIISLRSKLDMGATACQKVA